MSEVARLMGELMTATPPPDGSVDPAELLDQALAMAATRQPLLEQLAAAMAVEGTAAAEPWREELIDRDARWAALLVTARATMGQRVARAGAAHRRSAMRAYR